MSSILLCLPLLAPQTPFELDAESLAAESKLVASAIEEVLEVRLPEAVRFEISDAERIETPLRAELVPQFMHWAGDEEQARAQAGTTARLMSKALLAKYATKSRTVLVNPDVFAELAKLVDEPALTSRDAVRAVLVHECAHALAHELYDWPKVLTGLDSHDAISSYNAVIEGHAQFLARRVCGARGWNEGFETFTRAIGKGVPSGASAQDLLVKVVATTVASAYYDGERFVKAIHDAKGAEGLALVFREPPASPDLIFQPGWYLDPESRPEEAYDLEAGLDAFLADYDDTEWIERKLTITTAQLRAAIGALPEDVVDRIAKGLVRNFACVANPKKDPMSVQLVAAVYQFSSPAEAAHYVIAVDQLNRLKDEQMTTGPIRVKSAEYKELTGPGWTGSLAIKTMLAGGQEFPVYGVVATRAGLGLELVFSNREMGPEALQALITKMLAAAMKSEK